MALGHFAPQLVPSHVDSPPVTVGHASQALPQFVGRVLATHLPLHACVPGPQTSGPLFPLAPPEALPCVGASTVSEGAGCPPAPVAPPIAAMPDPPDPSRVVATPESSLIATSGHRGSG